MPQPSYPAGTDVTNWLTGTGLLSVLNTSGFTAAANLDQLAANAASLIEASTGRKFLASEATRNYSLPSNPRGALSLGQDLCSDETQESSIAVSVAGIAQIMDQDFVLGPENADNDQVPWTWIRFTHEMWYWGPSTNRRPIAITGYWGYSLQVPDDVWQAVVQKAAADAMPQIALAVSGGMASWQQAGVTENYSGQNGTPQSVAASSLSYWKSVVAARKRVSV